MAHHTDRNKGLLSKTMMRGSKKPERIPAETQKQIAEAASILYKLEKAISNKSKELIVGAYETVYSKDWWDYLPKGILNRYNRLVKEGNLILGI